MMGGVPQSYIEERLARALDEERIPYICQYGVYNSPQDLQPLYTLDFIIKCGGKIIGIECDGKAFHEDKKRDTKRTQWLCDKGIAEIIRFSTNDILYDINYCTNKIKRAMQQYGGGEYIFKQTNLRSRSCYSKASTGFVTNIVEAPTLRTVELYAASNAQSYNVPCIGAIAIQLIDQHSQKNSEIKTRVFEGVDKKRCQTLAILYGLKELKRSCQLIIYTDSEWLSNVCNRDELLKKARGLKDFDLLIELNKELSKHNYRFSTVQKSKNIFRNSTYRNLHSKSRQVMHEYVREKKKENEE